jgi:hypothetical protein
MTSFTPLQRYRIVLGLFILGLILSGVTAFPLVTELKLLCKWLGVADAPSPEGYSGLHYWILTVRWGLEHTHDAYPWLAYGTDWLAFAHIIIALFFVEPWLHPERGRGNLYVAITACLAVIPLAIIAGEIRGIPFYWRLIDCSFGIIGILPLLYCLRQLQKITKL